jgi:hypothetical protein
MQGKVRSKETDYRYNERGQKKYTGITICKDSKDDDKWMEEGMKAGIGK